MSKFLEQRCQLIIEWKEKEKQHLIDKQKTMRRLGELLNLHNKEEERNERQLVENQNQLD